MLSGEGSSRKAKWFPVRGEETEAAILRLVCLPYAGGTASVYRNWQEHLGDDIHVVPVMLPGRGARLQEEPHAAMEPLAVSIAHAMAEEGLARDYALFGHSMGGLLAYEVACVLRGLGHQQPRHLFVSGSKAPHLYGGSADHAREDEDLWQLVSDLGGFGTEPSVSSAYFARRLPVLRADLRVCDTYQWQPREPLRCSMTAFSATNDAIAKPADVEAWRAYTSSSFLRRHFSGSHFFLNNARSRERLLREVRNETNRLSVGLNTEDLPLVP